jgi:hypothetical protein
MGRFEESMLGPTESVTDSYSTLFHLPLALAVFVSPSYLWEKYKNQELRTINIYPI